MLKRVLVLLTIALVPSLAAGQTPDHRGEIVSDKPVYRGETASAPIPPHLHFQNEGGSDGQGLCVICSVIINGRYQGVPGLEGGKDSALWRAAKAAPGGYSPEKLERLLRQVMPHEKYASFVGNGSPADFELLERLSKAGYPIGATMNTGRLYNYLPIHHMVSLIHYRRNGVAMVVDNNRPGYYSIMPASEWNRRWPDMGITWAWIWTRLPEVVQRHSYAFGTCTLILAGTVFVLALRRKAQAEDEEAAQWFPQQSY